MKRPKWFALRKPVRILAAYPVPLSMITDVACSVEGTNDPEIRNAVITFGGRVLIVFSRDKLTRGPAA